MSVPNPNATTVAEMFTDADYQGGGRGEVVEEGSYQTLLTGRSNKTGGGIVYVEGVIQAGLRVGTKVDVFNVVLHKSEGQKSVGLTNLAAIGLDKATLNQLSLQLGLTPGASLVPLYEVIAAYVTGRVVNAELVQNTFDGKSGTTTKMQAKIGALALVSAPAPPAIGAAPGVPAAAPAAAPAVAVAPPPPAAVAPPPPPAVTPIAAPVAPAVAPAPLVAAETVPAAAEVGVATPASSVAPVAPPQAPEVAAVPAAPAAPAPGVVVTNEPSF